MVLLFKIYLLLLCIPISIFANLRLDYYYDQSEMYTKFSNWIPKRLHQWQPKHVEDFFLLYSLKQGYNTEELHRNIFFLKIALEKRFRHPSQALCKITQPKEYHKYRLLLFMHIHLKIMRSYLRLGSLFDKRHLYFYNLDFSDELEQSFQIAEHYYRSAIPYWKKARNYAIKINQYKSLHINLPMLESIQYDVLNHKDMNFGKFIAQHLRKLELKQKMVNSFLEKQNYQK